MEQSPRSEPDLETYKDAVWDFLLEHCDITERGSYFVKFHTSGRFDFEKRIRARYKYGYHRDDDRSGFDIRQKEKDATARRQAHLDRKEAKKRKHRRKDEVLPLAKQKEIFAEMKRQREALPPQEVSGAPQVMHRGWMQAVAHFWYSIDTLWQKVRAKNRKCSNASTAQKSTAERTHSNGM